MTMAVALGLTPTEFAAYLDGLTTAYELRINLQLLTTEHEHLGALPEHTAGQVDYDADSDTVDRSASLTIFDPDHLSGLDTTDPDSVIAYPKRMIRMQYEVRPVDHGTWVACPVFCGPVASVKRDGPDLTVELQGKESMMRRAIHGARTWKKGTPKTTVIAELLRMGGEADAYTELASFDDKLTSNLTVGVEGDVWALANIVANELAADLFYDGRGVAVLRPRSTAVTVTIAKSNGLLLKAPELENDAISNLVNRVKVTGTTTKGSEIAGVAVAPAAHPLSPASLGRNGVGLAWTLEVQEETATTTAKAQAKARELLDDELYLDDSTSALSVLPIPFLELRDVIRVQTDDLSKTHTIRKMTLPLVHTDPMTIGALGHVSRR